MFDHAVSDMDSGDGNELTPGFWWHVSMVHDGDDDIIYVDGIEANRKEAAGTLNATGRPFGIASNVVDGGQYFEGALDEVKVYNRAISSEEALSLYEKGTVVGTNNISPDLASFVDNVYPVPAVSDFNIAHRLNVKESLMIRIFDLQGRQVDVFNYDPSNIYSTIRLDIREYQSGAYFANFVLDGQNLGSIRFIKN
jgi:hypothetical protein